MKVLKPKPVCMGLFPRHLYSEKEVAYTVVARDRVSWGEGRLANKETRMFYCMCGKENLTHDVYLTIVTIEMTWEIGAETNEGTVTNFKSDWSSPEIQ